MVASEIQRMQTIVAIEAILLDVETPVCNVNVLEFQPVYIRSLFTGEVVKTAEYFLVLNNLFCIITVVEFLALSSCTSIIL